MKHITRTLVFWCVITLLTCATLQAQTTEFSYQGSLNTSGSPANGNHDFEFALFNGGGVQIGSTLTRLNVPVSNAVFAVQLDFGNQFQGADRFLEIRVRPSGGGAFTTLTPRQPLTSAPHAIRSLDAAQLGGVAASQYVLSGATSINATTQFNIGGNRVLSVPGNGNTLVGINSGAANTGTRNSFFGTNAGQSNTFASDNSFFGFIAGTNNTTGSANAFFGSNAGGANTTGALNSFFGAGSGSLNTTGTRNSFFGASAGTVNTSASDNSFFGHIAGGANTTGLFNSFFGSSAGASNTTGQSNSFFGMNAGQDNTTGSFNSFFGQSAGSNNTTGFNNSFFGQAAGISNTIGTDNSFFGTGAGLLNTTGSRNSFFGNGAGTNNTTAADNSFFGFQAGGFNSVGTNNSFFGSNTGLFNTGNRNSFFGQRSGQDNTAGSDNSFFGNLSGENNTTGSRNSFVGNGVGGANTTGGDNSFFGNIAGAANTTGNGNVFFGAQAGNDNTTGTGNTYVGTFAGETNPSGTNNSFFGIETDSSPGLINATAIGSRVFVSQSNSLVLGSINGTNGATADTNVGIGTTAPSERLHVVGNGLFTGTLSAATQFNIGVNRVLSVSGSSNTFTGINAGANNSGAGNSFYGFSAGVGNTTGGNNSFFGVEVGRVNTVGANNSIFGFRSGQSNTNGSGNSFFGVNAGGNNTTGDTNSIFGLNAGLANSTGTDNSAFGHSAAQNNTAGNQNSSFGFGAGLSNTGSNNSFFGTFADSTLGLTNASAFGFRAFVSQSNSLVLGGVNNVNGATADTNVGIGTTAPTNLLTIGQPEATVVNGRLGIFSPTGTNLIMRETTNDVEGIMGVNSSNGVIYGSMTSHNVNLRTNNTSRLTIDTSGNVGIGTNAPANILTIGNPEATIVSGSVGIFSPTGTNLIIRETTNNVEGVIGVNSGSGVIFGSMSDDFVRIRTNNANRLSIDGSGNAIFSGVVNFNSFAAVTLDGGGATPICQNAASRLATCGSSLRYKTNVRDFSAGLSVIKSLRPVSFNWKSGGLLDLGLVAEDVAKIEPLLTTTNDKGEIEGVKYDRIGVVLVNAVKEQQAQIEAQQDSINRLRAEVEALKVLVCAQNPRSAVCKPGN